MQSVTKQGFEVLNRAGETLAWRECPLDACDFFRAHAEADVIVRCSDAAIIRCKPRRVARAA